MRERTQKWNERIEKKSAGDTLTILKSVTRKLNKQKKKKKKRLTIVSERPFRFGSLFFNFVSPRVWCMDRNFFYFSKTFEAHTHTHTHTHTFPPGFLLEPLRLLYFSIPLCYCLQQALGYILYNTHTHT